KVVVEKREGRRSIVTSWLKKVFGERPIPLLEMNAETVDILYRLAECNESRDRDINLLIEDMKQKAAEYEYSSTYWGCGGSVAKTLSLSIRKAVQIPSATSGSELPLLIPASSNLAVRKHVKMQVEK
uniref:Uncharacterized protein n=1 Tax=Pseudonaja textilis TaxID=8673 RepID=A0A670YLS4_PSETE